MNPEQTPFPAGWLAIDLPDHRPCDGTYCFFAYDTLPPLDASLFRGNFDWLPNLGANLQKMMEAHKQTTQDKLQARLDQLSAAAQQLGLTLPAPFVKFMRSVQLQDQIPSCTACYFDLADHIVRDPLGQDAYFIRFLNDQQDVLLWYLYLNKQGDHCVLVSPIRFDTQDLSQIPAETLKNNTAFCAPSFEEFLYRFWMENSIWFSLNDGQATTELQQRYLAHYHA